MPPELKAFFPSVSLLVRFRLQGGLTIYHLPLAYNMLEAESFVTLLKSGKQLPNPASLRIEVDEIEARSTDHEVNTFGKA
mmetsp:Transcript_3363/g.7905  ORF Transcript_3363/g.7905 Transcript_3363/m.7905 type:complete len:80 (-) Transcript_3363:103-342(-)